MSTGKRSQGGASEGKEGGEHKKKSLGRLTVKVGFIKAVSPKTKKGGRQTVINNDVRVKG